MGAKEDPSVRFRRKVDVRGPDECWLWTGSRTPFGHGYFWPKRGLGVGAHRYAWMEAYGPIPDGLFVCHRCDNPGCVNPRHLFVGTQKDNMADCSRKGRVSRRGAPKLAEDDVRSVRERFAAGAPARALARELGVTTRTVHQITSRETWRSVT